MTDKGLSSLLLKATKVASKHGIISFACYHYMDYYLCVNEYFILQRCNRIIKYF